MSEIHGIIENQLCEIGGGGGLAHVMMNVASHWQE